MGLHSEIIAALAKIANGENVEYLKKNHAEINGILIHCRFVTSGLGVGDGYYYAYNVNPNTLTAQYELWVCGSSEQYYLIPIDVIKDIYNDPDAYVNKTPGQELMRTMKIVTADDILIFGKNSKSKQISEYWNKTL